MVRNHNRMMRIHDEFCPKCKSPLYLTVLSSRKFCKNCYEYKDKWVEVKYNGKRIKESWTSRTKRI